MKATGEEASPAAADRQYGHTPPGASDEALTLNLHPHCSKPSSKPLGLRPLAGREKPGQGAPGLFPTAQRCTGSW